MINYNLNTIYKYVHGLDILECDIDTLEDDPKFMMRVINYTNDKQTYHLCSDNVKNNYEFIKFIINKFKDDIEFIVPIANAYLANTTDLVENIELTIIMHQITKNQINKHSTLYHMLATSIYSKTRIETELAKSQNRHHPQIVNAIQLGFSYIVDDYLDNPIILDFFAEKLIDEIFNEYNHNLESVLHQRFITYEEFVQYGINNYLAEYIKQYDFSLSSYVLSHIKVLDKLKKSLTKIKLNWQTYKHNQEYQLYNNIIESVHEYMIEYNAECNFGEYEVLYYIAYQLGILKKLLKYECDEESYDQIIENCILDPHHMNLIELKHYYNIKKIITNLLGKNIDQVPLSKPQQDITPNILTFRPKSNKIKR